MTALNLGKYVTAQEQMNPDNDLNVKLSDLFTGAPSGVSPIDKKACRCRLESPGGPDVLLFTFDLLIPTKRLTGDDVMNVLFFFILKHYCTLGLIFSKHGHPLAFNHDFNKSICRRTALPLKANTDVLVQSVSVHVPGSYKHR